MEQRLVKSPRARSRELLCNQVRSILERGGSLRLMTVSPFLQSCAGD